MKNLVRPIVAAIAAMATMTVVGAAGPTAAQASTSLLSTSWSSYDQDALSAAATYRGDGTLTMTSTPSAVTDAPAAASSTGQIAVSQQTVTASDGSGTVLLVLALLGGTQLVVNEIGQSSGGSGAALVLQAGTSSIAGAYPLTQPSTTATTTARVTARRAVHEAHAVDTGTRHHGGHHARRGPVLATSNCWPEPYAPVVISSIFGPLIDGLGVVACNVFATMSLIVSVFRGGTRVGTVMGGTGGGTWLGINAYAVCTHISGSHLFHTAQLWAVNGVYQGGATSPNAWLHCK